MPVRSCDSADGLRPAHWTAGDPSGRAVDHIRYIAHAASDPANATRPPLTCGWSMKHRPTMSLAFPTPAGSTPSLARSSLGVSMPPTQSTYRSASTDQLLPPSVATRTRSTEPPEGSVSIEVTLAHRCTSTSAAAASTGRDLGPNRVGGLSWNTTVRTGSPWASRGNPDTCAQCSPSKRSLTSSHDATASA